MPIYEYQCEACSHILDALQKFDEPPLKKCPECGKPKLKRLLSAPMFLLKGSGWYETDFKKEHEQRRNLADRPEKEDKKEEGKDDKDKKESGTDEKKKEEKAQPKADTAASGKESKSASKSAPRRGPKRLPRPARKVAARRRKR